MLSMLSMLSNMSAITIPHDSLCSYKKEKFMFFKDTFISSMSSIEWSTSLYQVWIEKGMEDLVINQLSIKIVSLCGSLDCCISFKNFPKEMCDKLEYDKRHIVAGLNTLPKEKKEKLLPLLKDMLETIKKFVLEKKKSEINYM